MDKLIDVVQLQKKYSKPLLVCRTLLLTIDYDDYFKRWHYIKNTIEDVKIQAGNYQKNPSNETYNIIDNDILIIEEMYNDLKDDLYQIFKAPVVLFIENKKELALQEFYMRLSSYIEKYGDFNVASKPIISQGLQHIKELLIHILDINSKLDDKSRRLLNITQLENKLTLEEWNLKDWMNTFNGINLAMKYLNINEFSLVEKFKEIEVAYFVEMVKGVN